MVVSKNKALLALVAVGALLSSADSFAMEENQPATGWRSYFYNMLPSRSSLGYYGASALIGQAPLAMSTCIPRILDIDSLSEQNLDMLQGVRIGSAPFTQSMLDKYYQPTLAQQRKAQLIRALSGALSIGALAQYYGRDNLDWREKLIVMTVFGAYAGALPSMAASKEQKDEVERLYAEKNADRIRLEREAQQSAKAGLEWIQQQKELKNRSAFETDLVATQPESTHSKAREFFGYQ